MDVKQSNARFGDLISMMGDTKKKMDNENNWKSVIRNKIENDLENQVKEALDTPPVDKKWNDRKKAKRQKQLRQLQIMKLNSLHQHGRAPVFSRLPDETSSDRGFKYIDVNYAEKVAALAKKGKYENNHSFNKGLPGYDFARKNGLFKYGPSMPSDNQAHTMRGGLDVSLLDTSPSSLNFLSLPKHDNMHSNLRPIGQNGVRVITFNGISLPDYGPKRKCFQAYSKEGLTNLLNSRNRRNKLSHIGKGSYEDKRGVVLSKHGPFWPPGYGPVCKCPTFMSECRKREIFGPGFDPIQQPQTNNIPSSFVRGNTNIESKWRSMSNFHHRESGEGRHFISQASENVRQMRSERQHTTIGEFYSNDHNENRHRNHHHGDKLQNVNNKDQKPQWRGKPVIYDCERSSRTALPHAIPDGMPESLVFESRFESGNLRQVRRIGEYEYELVLRTDMYTKRHTQWYYFRIQNAQRNVTYKLNIINLLKKSSLYNTGMKPLVYSENLATEQNLGWHRIGENIKYQPWTNPTRNGLLSLDLQYYNLEFEVTFDWENVEEDSIYFSHCYPYTYTDLKRHLDAIMADPEQSQHVKREVLCETTAGNACFLLTITEFPDKEKDKYKDFHQEKKGVVITARVHPGESQASWMMKGVIDFLTSDSIKAKMLRKKTVFKIVPMLNPDGVIVGNYRTSLAARDLNRNYRHPRQTTFPTIWHTKQMMDSFSKDHEIILYCDLHGHSRKPMVFMYGCERKALLTGKQAATEDAKKSPRDCAKDFIDERLFPWIMYRRSPDRFSFHGSKYAVRKCKESTGRVVMFRQFGIMNSFTMEASFSGTMQKKMDSGRHFNIEDFLSVGRSLCESVFDYQRVCENHLLKSRVVMELTKDLAQHMMETNPQMMQTSATVASSNENNLVTQNNAKQQVDSEKMSESSKYPVNANRPTVLHGNNTTGEEEGKSMTKQKIKVEDRNIAGSRDNYHPKSTQETEISVLEPPSQAENTETEDELSEKHPEIDENCYRLLEQINFQGISVESDTSSDSDSESDPELPEESPNLGRKNKKKRRKKRPRYMKSVSAPLHLNSKKDGKDDQRSKGYTGFVNRYTHRSNGGIPIYAQERMQERAARRLAEMKLAEEEKIRRQNEIMLGKLDGSGIKDDDARARYAEVYGIRYQLGPHPNKPQYTIYNPFQDMTPPNGQTDSFPHQTPYRMKHEGKLYQLQHSHSLIEESSSSQDSRDNSAGSEPKNQHHLGEEKHSLPNPPRTMVPLQTLSFKFAGEGRQTSSTSLKSLNRDWMTSSYEDKLLSSVKEWDWEESPMERSKTLDLGMTLNKEHSFQEKMSTIDIGADFYKSVMEKQTKKHRLPTESRAPSSPPQYRDVFTPKNITQYEVVIGQNRYPIQIHRYRSDSAIPPVVTGESILNQKPSDYTTSSGQQREKRPQSADHQQIQKENNRNFEQKRHFSRTYSLEGNSDGSAESSRSSDQYSKRSEIPQKSNGLIFSVHKVSPKSSENNIGGVSSTPYPPKRTSTMFSPIVKPLTSTSSMSGRRRAFSLTTDPEFHNLNSAR